MYSVVNFSYLLLPLSFLLSRSKKNEVVPVALSIYGIICFAFIFFFNDIPRNLQTYFQTFYTFFEYIVFALIFWKNIEGKKARLLIIIASALFFLFQVFYVLIIKYKKLDTIPIGIETILILTYIIYFFYEFSKNLRSFYIYNHYGFWISVGILIYLGGSFFFFILVDHLSKAQFETFGNLAYVTELIKNILFTLAIFIYHKFSFENAKEKTASVPYLDMI